MSKVVEQMIALLAAHLQLEVGLHCQETCLALAGKRSDYFYYCYYMWWWLQLPGLRGCIRKGSLLHSSRSHVTAGFLLSLLVDQQCRVRPGGNRLLQSTVNAVQVCHPLLTGSLESIVGGLQPG